MNKTLPYLFACLMSTFLASCPLAGAMAQAEQGAQDRLSRKVDSLFADLDRSESPGAAVLVVRDGKILLRKGYGLANLEHRIPVSPETVFDIASVSKQFAGMAVAMLVEQRQLSLQDDIRRYIPELPDFGHKITIGHLVHHTSGLRDWPGTRALAGWRMDDVISYDQIIRMAFHQQDLNFRPGSEYLYSNTGYNLLVELVQRVTGTSFRKWTDEHIFRPLGMTHTHFHDDHNEVVPNKAYSYTRQADGDFQAMANNLTAIGSSSLYTTIDDLARWVMNFDKPRVGGEAVIEQMMQRGVLNNGKRIAYAFGLSMGSYRGLKTANHSGGWAGFSTFLLYFPEQHFSTVVLMNHNTKNPYKAAYAIADLYLAEELNPEGNEEEKPARKAIDLPAGALEKFTGIYRLGPAWYVTIARNGDQLSARATAEEAVAMTALSDSLFWIEQYGATIRFQRDGAGKVTRLLYKGMDCPKMEELPGSGTPPLEDFEGRYWSEELGTSYEIVREKDKLLARHRRHGSISLQPAWKDDFRGGEWFMNAVEFYRNKQGGVAGFKVTQGRNSNQRFVKLSSPLPE